VLISKNSKLASLTVEMGLILNGLHQISQDWKHETCFTHKESGLESWKLLEGHKEVQSSGVIREAS
jgi:hypothetical protein